LVNVSITNQQLMKQECGVAKAVEGRPVKGCLLPIALKVKQV
jgi:hypothetical protein